MNIEIAYQIEQMKKDGISDPKIANKLGLDVKDVFHTRRALGIPSAPGGAGKKLRLRVYDKAGNLVAEGSRAGVAKLLHYAPRTIAQWEKAENPTYRVERVEV